MLALMVSALAGSLGSRNVPDASLNQLATSTETVKFEVPGPTVIGVGNSISTSAPTLDVKANECVPPAAMKLPETVTAVSVAYTAREEPPRRRSSDPGDVLAGS